MNLWPESSGIRARFYDRHGTLEVIKGGLPEDVALISLKQVHGNKVISVTRSSGFNKVEGDASFTMLPKVALTVHTADCLPLLAHDRGIIGACHAGWRGLSAGIIQNWITEMKKAGASLGALKVAIGPAIGPCHFEVGKDVSKILGGQVSAKIKENVILRHRDPAKDFVNLPLMAKQHLNDAGVPAENITSSLDCTYCNEEKYFSYRRDGAAAGRLEGVIYRL